jgi:hypothetical protein
MPRGLQTVKTVIMRFQMGMGALLEVGPEVINVIVARNLSTFCPSAETLWEAEFKGDRLIW